MSEVYLAKLGVTYFSSSGPGSTRYIICKDKTLALDEEFVLDKNNWKNPSIQTPVSISEQATNDLDDYATAYKELERAKAKFALAKKVFTESAGGKEIDKILHPQPKTLLAKEVINENDLNVLITEVSKKTGCGILSVNTSVSGYDIPEIKLTLIKPALLSIVDKIEYNGYKWPKHGFFWKDTPEGKVVTHAIYTKDGRLYPPYRDEDNFEIENALIRRALEAEQNE